MSNNATVEQIAKQGLQFFDTLKAQQNQVFGENQAALAAITKAWAPILSGGAIPYGYSAGLDSLLQANVLQTGAQAETNAMNAEALREKQESGGANVMPTGASDAVNAQILATGQQKIATGLQQEKIAGFEQGVKNLEGATQAELGVAKEDNPTAYSEATVGAGSMAEQAGAEQFKENLATGPMSTFKGIAGGLGDLGKAASGFAGSFHKGGTVPGKPGEEKLIVVKAGEKIIPAPKNLRKKAMLHKVLAKDRNNKK